MKISPDEGTIVNQENIRPIEERKSDKLNICRKPCKEWKVRDVSDYDLETMIGKGTFGKVFKAKLKSSLSNENSEFVALKKLNMSREEEGFPITALREIQILKKLKHPNVVCLKDIVVSRRKYIVYSSTFRY